MIRVLLVLLVACGDTADEKRLLVYTHTRGYRHADAIMAADTTLRARLAQYDIVVDDTENPGEFTAENLARYRAVAFLYTAGNDVLTAEGKQAFEDFVRDGGGWFGLHSAADTEYLWPFYTELVVTPFRTHPPIQEATMTIEATSHPTMKGLPSPWTATDEWYDFMANARDTSGVTILATIDEASYSGGSTGIDHPMIWCHEELGGRAFYSALGHMPERWQEEPFLAHVDSAVRWVMRL